MADIFVSYAAEDRERARDLGHALEERGWSVWWDREIPLGHSYDDVIEQALVRARCVIVLWSRISVASEWVRSEAAEARRRGILVPAFLESVEPPLAFRLLHGADLATWAPGALHDEFEQLASRVGELLAHTTLSPAWVGESPLSPPVRGLSSQRVSGGGARRLGRRGWAAVMVAALGLASAGIVATRAFWSVAPGSGVESPSTAGPQDNGAIAAKYPRPAPSGQLPVTSPGDDFDSLASALQNVLGNAGAPPTLGATTAFELKEIAVHLVFVSKEQASTFEVLGLPSGAVVMGVGPGSAQDAGLHAGDVITGIGGAPIRTEQDLRQALRRVGPGKTRYEVRRGGETLTLDIDCFGCTAP